MTREIEICTGKTLLFTSSKGGVSVRVGFTRSRAVQGHAERIIGSHSEESYDELLRSPYYSPQSPLPPQPVHSRIISLLNRAAPSPQIEELPAPWSVIRHDPTH